MSAPSTARFTPAPHLELALVAGELCLLEPSGSELVILNDTARAVWELAAGGCDREAMVLQLVERFGTDPSVVRDGVRTILDELEQRGLLLRSR